MVKISVSFIGAGNVSWHLAPAFDNAGMIVREVYARNINEAKKLTKRLYQAVPVDHLDFSSSDSNVFILAVADGAIEDIAREIILPEGAVIVHTSASIAADILEYSGSEHFGVLYPLQSFSKTKQIDVSKVPLLLEYSNAHTRELLRFMANGISGEVWEMDAEKRRALHVAAVFANNFSNHMIKIAEDIVTAHGLDLSVLLPLIKETFAKTLAIGPEAAQTGPARRGDTVTMDAHVDELASNESLQEIYLMISRHISSTYQDSQ